MSLTRNYGVESETWHLGLRRTKNGNSSKTDGTDHIWEHRHNGHGRRQQMNLVQSVQTRLRLHLYLYIHTYAHAAAQILLLPLLAPRSVTGDQIHDDDDHPMI